MQRSQFHGGLRSRGLFAVANDAVHHEGIMNFVRCLALGFALALPALSAWAQDMPVATQAADRYQSDIQQRYKSASDPDKADALRIAGETAEQAEQTSVAISNYEQ